MTSHVLAAITAATPAPAAPDAPQIRDIVPPIDVFPYPPWMVAAAAGLAVVLLGIAVWAVIRWVRSRPGMPPPSARALAIRELETLRAEVEIMEPHAFSIAVSDVLRRFVGGHFGLHATRQTSPEFLAAISGTPSFSDDDRTLLASFLEKCDMIKFARIAASADDSRELLGSAIGFVQGARA